ncbi:DNA sulfur modification protein DndD [Petralouisia muris]|uniref:DNA sulfur modification protein DndD n=1 Tax=Petralouisia muris TaxID=3032872 RepID=A0AC61RR09_9FIRM|nr:AAA family ATPase [Petralouisia muris]TGY91526.1 DNA sulfur modification protein DndD [Petralouisia muris]
MRFERITINNFMRYKGENTLEFSCEKEKNVTVVLGDNTVGKTTIAQAFRWCLYGAVLTERGKRQEDYQLLNTDALSLMDANSRAKVWVELVAADEEKRYTIRRETVYTRAFPAMTAEEFQKKLAMYIADVHSSQSLIEVEPRKVDELINELFPRNLSHYFLFDGERWSDISVNGVKENIRDSVHILTGLSAYQAAMRHLKDMGAYSVISKLKKKIVGSGNLYDNLEADCRQCSRKIEHCKKEIENIEINLSNYNRKCEEIQEYLNENRNTESLQSQYDKLGTVKKSQADLYLNQYKNLVNEFSNRAYMLFAEPMIGETVKLVKTVAGERRDVPHMRQATIDHIIQGGRCICGTPLIPNSKEWNCLIEQRNYLPPADIGSLLGEFERTASWWRNHTVNLQEELREKAALVDDSVKNYEETCNEYIMLEQRMDEHIDFAEHRRRLKSYQKNIQDLSRQKGELQGQIQSLDRQKIRLEEEMQGLEARNDENRKWRARVELAESLYRKLHQDFWAEEKKVFLELNKQIQYNFGRMFNAKDKKIELSKQYEIQMYYKSAHGFREERNLSEGEKIARNFAFIVTIMDYSKKRKKDKSSEISQGNDTLPIVLDGPFSKLGDENIRLISKVLPEVSEQVILFMLKKDWKYTNLDAFVGSAYSIEKDAEKSYALIRKVEESKYGSV